MGETKKKVIKKIVKNPVKTQKIIPKMEALSSIDRIQNLKLKETVLSAKSKGIKINYETKLTVPLEVEEYFKEELGSFLKEKYNDVHERASELRKFGYDGIVWNFQLMSIPLKMQVFLSTGEIKDFNNIIQRLNKVLEEVVKFEKMKEEKEKIKELEEKRKEQIQKLKESKRNQKT